MLTLLFIYFFAAAISGITAGLFGGGIGLALVPIMVWIFNSQGVPEHLVMHMAIGTSVTAIIFIGAFSSYSHHKRKSVEWQFLRKMSPAMVIGIVFGALLADHVSSKLLMLFFGIISILLAIRLFTNKKSKKTSSVNFALASNKTIHSGAVFIGFLGSMLGVNSFAVPFFQKIGLDIRSAIGTSAVIGTVLAIGIAIMYLYIGSAIKHSDPSFPAYCTGYINWAACIPIAIGASVFTPLGVKIAHSIPKKVLETFYGVLLLVIAVKMMISAIY